MSPKNQHSRILLSKNESGAVGFCEACDVVEMEIGAISLRVDSLSLDLLSRLLNEAAQCLKILKVEKAGFIQTALTECNLH
ncbi:MAG: hypothetical protein Q7T42_07305 [Methylotenera sp.]|uniref:hypothetical protein n=1 Tax=Methylotenera sp. TaxID=2051956 RepID=UPI002720D788|nr:hypothetical protein [Methylotenera sp.]MDO9393761.1 hypothetical protein [Methylotenera sp.]MDP1524101.1 hypothetical protein [Methylotenera sp.]MDP3308903.1 hypothetical protein [Methylotenera sp.]